MKINRPEDFLNLNWYNDLSETSFGLYYPEGWKDRPFDNSDVFESIKLIDNNTIAMIFAKGVTTITIKGLKEIDIETVSTGFTTLTFIDFENITVTANINNSIKVISEVNIPEKLQILGYFLN